MADPLQARVLAALEQVTHDDWCVSLPRPDYDVRPCSCTRDARLAAGFTAALERTFNMRSSKEMFYNTFLAAFSRAAGSGT